MSGRRTGLVAAALFAAALLLRAAALDRERTQTGDEAMHVASTWAFAERGHLGPDWHHPPVRHLLTYASMRLAGDGPWGWRLPNAVTGAAAVALVFLAGVELLGSALAAALAAVLLALDPLEVTLSRSSFEDVPAACFLLAGVLLALRHARTGRAASLAGAGLALGTAAALKSYMLVPLAAVGLALALLELRRRRPERLVEIGAALVAVPFLLWLVQFLPWFLRGYGFREWLSEVRWAMVNASTLSAEGFNAILLRLGGPARWFTSEFGVGFHVALADGGTRDLVLMNDAPVWMAVLPAVAASAWLAWRDRRWQLAVAPALFAALYLPFLAAPRPIFLYSSVAVLPFGLLAIAGVAGRLAPRLVPALLVAATAWGLYLYPLAVGAPIPESAYAWILEDVDVVQAPR